MHLHNLVERERERERSGRSGDLFPCLLSGFHDFSYNDYLQSSMPKDGIFADSIQHEQL